MTCTQDTTFEDKLALEEAFDYMEAVAAETEETNRRLKALYRATQDREDQTLRDHSRRLEALNALERAREVG